MHLEMAQKENFSVRLDAQQREQVRQIASDYGLPEGLVVQMAVRALIKYVDTHGSLPPMLNLAEVVADKSLTPAEQQSRLNVRLNEPRAVFKNQPKT